MTCGSCGSLSVTLSGDWISGANILPDRLEQAEAAIKPLLPDIENATQGTIEFVHLSQTSAFALLLELGRQNH